MSQMPWRACRPTGVRTGTTTPHLLCGFPFLAGDTAPGQLANGPVSSEDAATPGAPLGDTGPRPGPDPPAVESPASAVPSLFHRRTSAPWSFLSRELTFQVNRADSRYTSLGFRPSSLLSPRPEGTREREQDQQSGTLRRKNLANSARSSPRSASSGIGRRMRRTVNPHVLHRRYRYSQWASRVAPPTFSMSEKQQALAWGGETMRCGYRLSSACAWRGTRLRVSRSYHPAAALRRANGMSRG